MKFKKLKNKKGFSLVEVAIAMAVVSIVTITAIAIIYPATDKTKEANAQSAAIYFAADAIECFKAVDIKLDGVNPSNISEFYDEFYDALMTTRIISQDVDDDGNVINTYYEGVTPIGEIDGYEAFRINGSNCIVYIRFDFILNAKEPRIIIKVTDSAGNYIIPETTYRKSLRGSNENKAQENS